MRPGVLTLTSWLCSSIAFYLWMAWRTMLNFLTLFGLRWLRLAVWICANFENKRSQVAVLGTMDRMTEPGEASASPWMQTWRSPRNKKDLPAPPDPQRHRSVNPSPTTAAPRRGVGQCPRQWNTCNKRSQICTTDQTRSGVFRRQSSWTLSDVVGARRAPKWTEVVHNHANDFQYTAWAKCSLDDYRRPRRWRHSSSQRLPWCSDHDVDEKTLLSTAWSGPRRPHTLSKTCHYRVHTDHRGSRHVNFSAGQTSCRSISLAATTLASLELSSIACRPFGQ